MELNKSVISKYLEEFLWWLEHDNIMCKELTADGSTRWRTLANPVWNSTPKNEIQELMYVINGEYVEFRIQQAEGKTIQFRRYHI